MIPVWATTVVAALALYAGAGIGYHHRQKQEQDEKRALEERYREENGEYQ